MFKLATLILKYFIAPAIRQGMLSSMTKMIV